MTATDVLKSLLGNSEVLNQNSSVKPGTTILHQSSVLFQTQTDGEEHYVMVHS